MELERRAYPGEVSIRSGGSSPKLRGYAAVFGVESNDLGGFREVVMPGAFDRSIRDKTPVVARTQHRSEQLLGTTEGGTLRLWTDTRGLGYEIDLPNTTAGRDVLEYVKRGDIRHSSFAFYADPSGVKWEKRDGEAVRQLVDVELVDVAPVIGPAYPNTEVSARALEEARQFASGRGGGVPNEINALRLRLSCPPELSAVPDQINRLRLKMMSR